MPFITGDVEVPFQIRLARVLLYVEAGIFLLALIFQALVAVVGSSTGATTSSVSVDDNAGVVVPLLIVGIVAFAYTGYEVAKLTPWARWAAIALQVVLLVLLLARNPGANVIGTAIAILIILAVILSLTLGVAGTTFAAGTTALPRSTTWVPPTAEELAARRRAETEAEAAASPAAAATPARTDAADATPAAEPARAEAAADARDTAAERETEASRTDT